jgi:hypothetical protein
MPSRNSFTDSRILAISCSQFWLKEGSINLDGSLLQSVAFAPCMFVVNRWLMARLRQRGWMLVDTAGLLHLRHCERSEAIHLGDRRKRQMDCRVASLLAMTKDQINSTTDPTPDRTRRTAS